MAGVPNTRRNGPQMMVNEIRKSIRNCRMRARVSTDCFATASGCQPPTSMGWMTTFGMRSRLMAENAADSFD
jgi:hypothetical protein